MMKLVDKKKMKINLSTVKTCLVFEKLLLAGELNNSLAVIQNTSICYSNHAESNFFLVVCIMLVIVCTDLKTAFPCRRILK